MVRNRKKREETLFECPIEMEQPPVKSVQGNLDLLDWESYQLEENCRAPPPPWPPFRPWEVCQGSKEGAKENRYSTAVLYQGST